MFSPPPRRCDPPRWARGGHAQTLLGHVLPTRLPASGPRAGWRAVSLPLADGGALAAWHRPGARGPVVVLWHGLGGSTSSPYLRVAADACARRGHAVLAVLHRGSGGTRERTCLPYMAGNTRDLVDALLWTRARHPGRSVFLVGFSLSGNTLLKGLGEEGGPRPEAALAVNPAVDLDLTSRHLLRWPQRGYDLWILRACRRWVPRLRGTDGRRYRVPALASLREFDARYIAPVWGFPDRETYYREASSAARLAAIRTPTAILAAADDPIVPLAPLREARRSPAVALHVEPHGGHLGFLSRGRGGRVDRWLDHALGHYLDQAAALATTTDPSPAAPAVPCAP